MIETDMEGKPLYKIGSNWVFDIDSYIGYRVIRQGKDTKSKVVGFSKAFEIHGEGDSYNVKYEEGVPIGIVRKAVHLIGLSESGELSKFGKQFR